MLKIALLAHLVCFAESIKYYYFLPMYTVSSRSIFQSQVESPHSVGGKCRAKMEGTSGTDRVSESVVLAYRIDLHTKRAFLTSLNVC